MKPAVSVVIATYNYARFLAGAIDSVLGQTFSQLEVVVVDDGSIDETPEVLAQYRGDPRVRSVRTERAGASAARNTGVRLTRAPLVAFLDADDLWLPTKLEKQAALFAADPDVGLVYTRRLLVDEHGRGLPTPQPAFQRGPILEAVFRDNFICFSSAVVRRSVLAAAGPFDEALPLAIDYDLWLRVLAVTRADYVDEPLVKYRTGHANLSRRAEERYEIAMGVMRRFLDARGGRRLLAPALVRRAWAETYFHLGLLRQARSRREALPCYVRAITASPGFLRAWKGLAALALPGPVRRAVRRMLRRPEWSVPPALPCLASPRPPAGPGPEQPGEVLDLLAGAR